MVHPKQTMLLARASPATQRLLRQNHWLQTPGLVRADGADRLRIRRSSAPSPDIWQRAKIFFGC